MAAPFDGIVSGLSHESVGRVTGNQLARQAKDSLSDRVGRVFKPFGLFLRGFLDNPKMVGAVFPSSSKTVSAMLERIDWPNCKVVVEYGPGVGTFCQPILDRLPAGAQLIAIDLNPEFIDHLNETIDDPRFTAVLGSATDVEQIVANERQAQADVVISGLPISTLPDGVADKMVAATYRVLKPGGAFLTYQYTLTARKLTATMFDRMDEELVLLNIPPNFLTWGWKEG